MIRSSGKFPQPVGVRLSVSLRLAVAWLCSALIITTAPLNFGPPADGRGYLQHAFLYGDFERSFSHVALNVLLFVPLGILLHHECVRRRLPASRTVVLTVTIGLLISVVVESLQVFLPDRDSSLFDVGANTLGAIVGVIADRIAGHSMEQFVDRWYSQTTPRKLAGVMAGFLLGALVFAAALQAQTRLVDWSTEYPLLIGNELTRNRPWQGRVFSLEITDEATSYETMRSFAAGEPATMSGAVLAKYDFRGPSPYRSPSGNEDDLEWVGPAPRMLADGVRVSSQSWLRTRGPASSLVQRVERANAFTIHLTCAPDAANQTGPARIVSNSRNPLLRNFTIGQDGRDLIVRLRTPATGSNGVEPETVVRDAFATLEPRDFLISYDGATLLVAIAREHRVLRTELTPAVPMARALNSSGVLATDLPAYDIAYLALLSLPPCVLVAVFARTTRERSLFGALWIASFSVLLELTLVAASGRAFDPANIVKTAAVATLVLAASVATLTHSARGQGQLVART